MRIASLSLRQPGVSPLRSPALFQPALGSGTSCPAFLNAPAGLLRVYFGAQVLNTPLDIQKAVDWSHHQNPLPPLHADDRRNHRVHLARIGELLGVLPKTPDAMTAYRQYVAVFDAMEAKAAPGKKDYRMVSYDKFSPVASGSYLVRQYGYHVLVFSPEGAVESFRKVTPPSVEMDGQTQTDYIERMRLFNQTHLEAEDLKLALASTVSPVLSPLMPLSDPAQYTRVIYKTTSQGLDAWGQPAQSAAEVNGNASAYQAFCCQYP